MAALSRTALLTRIHKTLKKHYRPIAANLKMPLLEQLLFASCLEDATPQAAEKAFAAVSEQYFDWNEVRVSTVTELAETLVMLPEPAAAASRIKRVLQSVFESTYSFDLEALKKQNIGAAQKKLSKSDGVTRFGAAYVTQTALGGHCIPLCRGALEVIYILGVISDKERSTGNVSGLERAIPKNKGIEFGSMLNQLGVEYQRNPFAPPMRKLLLSISPDAKNRFPKRGAKPAEAEASGQPAAASNGEGSVAAPAADAKKAHADPPKSAAAPQQKGKEKPAPAKPKAIEPKKAPPAAAKKRQEPKRSVPAPKPAAHSKKPAAIHKSSTGRTPPRKPR